jgi:hypothetical protein
VLDQCVLKPPSAKVSALPARNPFVIDLGAQRPFRLDILRAAVEGGEHDHVWACKDKLSPTALSSDQQAACKKGQTISPGENLLA